MHRLSFPLFPYKDIVTRYAHQSGFHVERRFGWDCHGLPVEYEIDKTLGLKVRCNIVGVVLCVHGNKPLPMMTIFSALTLCCGG